MCMQAEDAAEKKAKEEVSSSSINEDLYASVENPRTKSFFAAEILESDGVIIAIRLPDGRIVSNCFSLTDVTKVCFSVF